MVGFWCRPSSWFIDGCLLVVSSQGKKRDYVFSVSPCKGTNLIMRAPPSWPNCLPKAPPPNTIMLGIRASTCEFGRDTNSQFITGIASLEGCTFYFVKEGSNFLKVVRAINTSLWIQFHLELFNLMVEGLIILPGLPPHFLARETKVQRREAFLPGPKLETNRAGMRTQAFYLLFYPDLSQAPQRSYSRKVNWHHLGQLFPTRETCTSVAVAPRIFMKTLSLLVDTYLWV